MDTWHLSTYLGACALVGLVLYNQRKKPLALVVPWTYALFYSVHVSFWIGVGAIRPLDLAVKYAAAKTLALLLLFWMFVRELKGYHVAALGRGILFIFLLDALWLLAGGEGIMVGYTQDSLFIAVLLPLLWKDELLWRVWPVYVGAIIFSMGSGAYLCLGLSALALAWDTKNKWARAGCLAAVACGAWLVVYSGKFGSTRWHAVWKEHLLWWGGNTNNFIGAGPGSFEWVSSAIGVTQPRMWMHGDWLQVMFEYGLVGLVLSFMAYAWVLMKLGWTARGLSFGLFGIAIMVYSPLQFVWGQVYVAIMVCNAAKR